MLQWQSEFVRIYLKLPLFLQVTFTIFFTLGFHIFFKNLISSFRWILILSFVPAKDPVEATLSTKWTRKAMSP